MAVAFKELDGSPVETWGKDGFTAKRTLLVPWSQRNTFAREVLGDGAEYGGVPTLLYPGFTNVYPETVRFTPFDPAQVPQALTALDTDLASYTNFAQAEIDYRAQAITFEAPQPPGEPVAPEPNTILDYSCEIGAEAIELDAQDFQWVSGTGEVFGPEYSVYVRVALIKHTFTWKRVIRPPYTAIAECAGTLHDVTNFDEFLGAPDGCLLFEGGDVSREFAVYPSGEEVRSLYTVKYVFSDKRIKWGNAVHGWDVIWRRHPPGQGQWDKIKDHNNNPVFQRTDFNRLLRYE